MDVLARSVYCLYSVRTQDQLEDFLTKSYAITEFRVAWDLLMVPVSDGVATIAQCVQLLRHMISRAAKM